MRNKDLIEWLLKQPLEAEVAIPSYESDKMIKVINQEELQPVTNYHYCWVEDVSLVSSLQDDQVHVIVLGE